MSVRGPLLQDLRGIAPTDAPTRAAAVLALGAGALTAAYLPARRALAADPMAILRSAEGEG